MRCRCPTHKRSMMGSMPHSAAISSAPQESSSQTMGSFLSSLHCYHYPHFLFSPRSIVDKAIVLDKTRLVTQRAIMESNCFIDTELTLPECDHSYAISRAINGRGNTTRPGAFFRISDEGTVSIEIAQYYLYTSSI